MRIVRNTRQGSDAPAAPQRDTGIGYTYELIAGDRRVYADTPAELLDFLILGYAQMESELDKLTARIRHALGTVVRVQAVLNDMYSEAAVTPQEFEALRSGGGAQVDTWDCPVPLVLVESLYAPVTDVARPLPGAGSILWLQPEEEFEYLVTLHALGVVVLNMSTDKAV